MFRVPEEYRITHGQPATSPEDGNNGVFVIPFGSDIIQCIASDGYEWEHVSCLIRTKNRIITIVPTWNVMCFVKNIFWDKEDWVIQYHSAESEYIDNHPNVLHLWRPMNQEFPHPPSKLVGVK